MKKAILISICGIDGAGKTTLIQRLRVDPSLSYVSYFEKTRRRNADAVMALYGSTMAHGEDRQSTRVREAFRIANVLDFLVQYSAEAEPLLGESRCIVTDRWTPCSLAKARGTGAESYVAALVSKVPPPDLVLYLDIPVIEAQQRLVSPDFDEDIDTLRRFRQSYEEVFLEMGLRIVRIADLSADKVYERVKKEVARCQSLVCADRGKPA